MRAILIDPFTATVREVDHEGGLESMYRLLGCDLVDCVGDAPVPGHDLWVDDEGLLKDRVNCQNPVHAETLLSCPDACDHGLVPQRLFKVTTTGLVYAGRGLVLTADDEGECTAATATVAEVIAALRTAGLR